MEQGGRQRAPPSPVTLVGNQVVGTAVQLALVPPKLA